MKRLLLALLLCLPCATLLADSPPNVIIFFLDDSGYADFQPFGDGSVPTPNADRLASEGMRLNQFYVPQAICSASRSALLTGCYPGRTKMFGAHGPRQRGLDPSFATIAEVLNKRGYATAHFGKWHCGDQPDTRPMARGFDEHAGLMYSNDMWRFHPKDPEYWGRYPLQYWENGKIRIEEVSREDQAHLTSWATDYATDFIRRHPDQPYFLYLAHSMPHVPLFCSDKFQGKSGAGLYGDVIMELDWSLGELMKAVRESGNEDRTIILFSSDNGPWSEYGNHAGKTPFREHKGTSWDGGVRSATILKYPDQIPAGSVFDKALCSIDLLPTLAGLTGADLPGNEIDGLNLWPFLTGKTDRNPHDYYALSAGRVFTGIISGDGKWKLMMPHSYRHVVTPGKDGLPGKTSQEPIGLSLFNLEEDPFETTDIIEQNVKVAETLQSLADAHRNRFYLD